MKIEPLSDEKIDTLFKEWYVQFKALPTREQRFQAVRDNSLNSYKSVARAAQADALRQVIGWLEKRNGFTYPDLQSALTELEKS